MVSPRNLDWAIDASTEDGSLGRLVNHSRKQPNVIPKCSKDDEKPAIFLCAARKLCVGEELLYDYGERRRSIYKDHPWIMAKEEVV